jgi:hypothetical protein
MIFKKKIDPDSRVKLALQVRTACEQVNRGAGFIQAFGEYKKRSQIKLSDREFLQQIDIIVSDIQATYTKCLVAEYLLKANGLGYLYEKNLKEIAEFIAPQAAQAAQQAPQPKVGEKGGPDGKEGD